MTNLTQLRLAAREIFQEAVRAVDPFEAVSKAVRLSGRELFIKDVKLDLGEDRTCYSIAAGKAAIGMALALEDILGDRFTAGILSSDLSRGKSKAAQVNNLRHRVFNGGHPEPNEDSLAAARASMDLLMQANAEDAVVIFLISGGGSAMLEWPNSDDITLADLRAANSVLVKSGASISEINAMRRGFSAVKGGRLAARASNCDLITLIVSDVPAGEEYNVASGPSIDPQTELDPPAVVARYQLQASLPPSILAALNRERKGKSSRTGVQITLLDNRTARESAVGAAQQRGFHTEVAENISDQMIERGCPALLDFLGTMDSTSDCVISGGEFACPVHGDGIGGRNLESALRLAIEWDKRSRGFAKHTNFVALCAGTDGVDGNSPAAGAIVDSTTIARAVSVDLDPQNFLERSDSYSFFIALGDVIATGPTGTNVRDLRILLKGDDQ